MISNERELATDAVDYARALEAMYGGLVVLRLVPTGATSRSTWRVEARYIINDQHVPFNGAIQRGCSYPSMHHKTFGGAALFALADLEEAVRAYVTLNNMGYIGKE